jgi:hypothetical protein
MITDADVEKLVGRIASMWPVAKGNTEYQQQVKDAVLSKAATLTEADLSSGFRTLCANGRMSRDDGGPAWPPSVGEVTGCMLKASRDRRDGCKELPVTGARRVAGRMCRRCQGHLHFLPGDDVLHCGSCNAVMGVGAGIRMEWSDIQRLEFADSAVISEADVAAAKDATLTAVRRMQAKAA